MATYKVIQDIEAEDKLLGPLTLRQFIYAAIVFVLGFIAFRLAVASPFLVIPFLPPMIFFGTLAAPFGHDQSSEVWLLAKIRFFLKPRRRIWDQGGVQELVTITAPKKIEKHLTDGLSPTEVKSRLRALATTIDSRGWAVKNVNVNMYDQASYLDESDGISDRLVDGRDLPRDVPAYEVYASDDILDETNNPTAQNLDAMIIRSEQAHRQTLLATVQGGGTPAQQPANNWFMQDAQSLTNNAPVNPSPISALDEQKLLENIHKENARPNPAYGHTKVLDPSGKPTTPKTGVSATDTATTQTTQTKDEPADTASSEAKTEVITRLASSNDLNVATIAREADKTSRKPPSDEVTISLR